VAGGEYVLSDRAGSPAAPLSAAGHALHDRFVAAIDDDLDMPVALALLREILRAPISAHERRWLLLDADAVLGLDQHRIWDATPDVRADDTPADIAALLAARVAARAARDWGHADAIRADLAALGWDVIDGPDESSVRRRP
jgi:cysteinyl-tRNA synthetase